MTTGESPAVVRRRLRLALRKARETKAFTQTEVAKRLGWSLSKVNRIESGDVTISDTDLRALLRVFDVTDGDQVRQPSADAKSSRQRGWWDEPRYREHLTPPTMQLLRFETEAVAIRVFQPTMVPGILQTPVYASFVVNFFTSQLYEPTRAARLEIRLRRQEQVFNRPDPPHYFLFLDESVLFREVGGVQVMADQPQVLLGQVHESNASMRVVPLAIAASMTMPGAFTIPDLGDAEDAVLYRESVIRDETTHCSDPIRSPWEVRSLDEAASAQLIEAQAGSSRCGPVPASQGAHALRH